MDFEGYCVKCREKRQVTNGEVTRTEKGRPMAKGTCPVCGTKVTRFLSEKDVK
jgi:acyl-coenzyme A thioesterase PaaI-like protein